MNGTCGLGVSDLRARGFERKVPCEGNRTPQMHLLSSKSLPPKRNASASAKLKPPNSTHAEP